MDKFLEEIIRLKKEQKELLRAKEVLENKGKYTSSQIQEIYSDFKMLGIINEEKKEIMYDLVPCYQEALKVLNANKITRKVAYFLASTLALIFISLLISTGIIGTSLIPTIIDVIIIEGCALLGALGFNAMAINKSDSDNKFIVSEIKNRFNNTNLKRMDNTLSLDDKKLRSKICHICDSEETRLNNTLNDNKKVIDMNRDSKEEVQNICDNLSIVNDKIFVLEQARSKSITEVIDKEMNKGTYDEELNKKYVKTLKNTCSK